VVDGEAECLVPAELEASFHGDASGAALLPCEGLVLAEFAPGRGCNEVSGRVDGELRCPIQPHLDGARIGAGPDVPIEFELILLAIEREANAGEHVVVGDVGVMGDADAPVLGLAQHVVGDALQFTGWHGRSLRSVPGQSDLGSAMAQVHAAVGEEGCVPGGPAEKTAVGPFKLQGDGVRPGWNSK